MGPLFEQHPWAVVALIIVTLESWQLFRATLFRLLRQLKGNSFTQAESADFQK